MPAAVSSPMQPPAPAFRLALQHLQLGQKVTGLTVRLVRDTTTPPSTTHTDEGTSRRSRKKAKWASRAPIATGPQSHAPHGSALMMPSSADRTRVCLVDDSASVVGEVATKMLAKLDQSASGDTILHVQVDAIMEMQGGKAILNISSLVAAPTTVLDDDATESQSSSLRRSFAPLLTNHSLLRRGSGMWVFRLVAGELFVLLRPINEKEDADTLPPHRLVQDSDIASSDMSDDDADESSKVSDASLRCALAALREGSDVREDEVILLPTVTSAPFLHQDRHGQVHATAAAKANKRKRPSTQDKTARVLSSMYCGLVLGSSRLSGDSSSETSLERDHWHHAARALFTLPPEWVESLTQVTTSVMAAADWWAECAGLGEDEDTYATDDLFDENDRALDVAPKLTQTENKNEEKTNKNAPCDFNARDIALGLTPSSGEGVIQFVRSFQRALDTANEKLRQMREDAQNEEDDEDVEPQEEEEEQAEEDEDEESAGGDEESDASMEAVEEPTTSKQSASRRVAPTTSATQYGNGEKASSAPSTAPMTPARKKELVAGVRSLKASIRSGRSKLLPVSILTGFLGSGKTTLLNHLLHSDHGLRIGVIVNDFSHVNVDASLLNSGKPEHLVELSNGCICCTLREDLFTSVVELAVSGKVDYIAIESTGLGEPAPIVATFTFELDDAADQMETYGLKSLQEIVQLDTVTTVVDSQAVYQKLLAVHSQAATTDAASSSPSSSSTSKKKKKNGSRRPSASTPATSSNQLNASDLLAAVQAGESSAKSIQTLLTEQLEYCNVLVLNKADLLTAPQLQVVEEFVTLINCNADVLRAEYGKVDVKEIIGGGKFTDQHSLESPLLAFAAAEWHASLVADRAGLPKPHAGEAAEYGVTSFVYHRRVGFSGVRFEALLRDFEKGLANGALPQLAGLLRVKGVFWTDANDAAVGLWQATTPGTKANISHVGGWLLDLCAPDCVTSGSELLNLATRWHPLVRDRYTQLVFIGTDIDQAAITNLLDERCLMTRQEMEELFDDEDEDEEEAQAADEKLATERAKLVLLKPVVDFDPSPDATGTCSLKPPGA